MVPSVLVLAVVVAVRLTPLGCGERGDVILRLGSLPEPWESENTSEDLRRS